MILTCATNLYQYEFVMLCSIAKNLNYDLKVCGSNLKWEGCKTKYKAYYEELLNCEENDLIICADAYDTIPLRSYEDFKSIYNNNFSNNKIVASAETNCIPGICQTIENWKGFSAIRNRRKYVNSGLICGKAKALKKFWKLALDSDILDDQIFLGKYMNLNDDESNITLDHESLLMQTAVNIDNKNTFAEDLVSKNSMDGGGVCFLHLPALGAFQKQRKVYSEVLKAVALRTNLEHAIHVRWATRFVPFQLDAFVVKLLFVIGVLVLLCVFLVFNKIKR